MPSALSRQLIPSGPPIPDVAIPWATKEKTVRAGWPRRLLHVGTMTSYLREGENKYHMSEAPPYNVISYTWGRFTATVGTSLVIHGIDWPIPVIAPSHFTAETFQQTLKRAARGRYHYCEWLWVDIACIPQRHIGESQESARIRNEEIGRQLQIFRGAKEVFAWLNSLATRDFLRDESGAPPATISSMTQRIDKAAKEMNEGGISLSSFDALEFLNSLEKDSRDFLRWTTMILKHRWFTSLWTLQEMILRPDANILLDDSILELDDTPMSMQELLEISHHILWMSSTPRFSETIRNSVAKASHQAQASTFDPIDEATFMSRLESILPLYMKRGLDLFSFRTDYPHPAYCAAKHREAERPLDRIIGIMQIYAISCNPEPPGADVDAKLRNLEDDFGKNLVAQDPLLSQLFTHMSGDPPRRSWLITQNCTANDIFWWNFCSDRDVAILFGSLTTEPAPHLPGIHLRLKGQAWDLLAFVRASSPTSEIPDSQKNELFSPASSLDQPEKYLGLILDYHESVDGLGTPARFFPSHNDMYEAVRRLDGKYRLVGNGRDEEKVGRQSHVKGDAISMKVVPLGCCCHDRNHNSKVHFVGLVVAPISCEFTQITAKTGESQIMPASAVQWKRVGLMRWIEDYSYDRQTARRHYHLPAIHNFEAVVI